MTVKELVQKLLKHNLKNEVVFYKLDNHELTRGEIETIINADGQTEITIQEGSDKNVYN
tara:strand:+ start:684 stop:860 length:177 start_codon:yes stop_codon:yes gene_type:complete